MGTQRSQCSDANKTQVMAECALPHINANNESQWTDRICFLFLQDEGRILSTLHVLLGSIFSIYNPGAAATDLLKT